MTAHSPRRTARLQRALTATVVVAVLVAGVGLPRAQGQAPAAVDLTRIAAADRFATAAAIARATFPSASSVYLARADGSTGFADALAANYAAGVAGVPVLLAVPDTVPQATLDAIAALGAQTVHLLGGTGALSAAVESSLRARGLTVDRISGADRFATAAAVARAPGGAAVGTSVDGKRTAVLSSGRSFPDALAAGGIVYNRHFPQLLTEPGSLPAATASVLGELTIQHVIITGGASAISTAVEQQITASGMTVERVAGPTRYDTAAALADMAIDRFGFGATHVDVATGDAFPDALAGGSHAGATRAAIILTQTGAAHPAACGFVQRRAATLIDGHVLGGAVAVADAAVTALEGGCPAAPSGGSVVVNGHGFGHGRGLGQWGANGYAVNGVGSADILQHFYSNTTAAAIDPNTTISVRLLAHDNTAPRVTSGQPFSIGGIPFQAGDAAWVTAEAEGWIVHGAVAAQGGCSGPEVFRSTPITDPTFVPAVVAPGSDLTAMLAVCNGGGDLPRYYRGVLQAAFDAGVLRFVNILPLEEYLRGVVPRESPASWPAAALQAQAVAARSYAMGENRYPYAKTCDTTSCQVYSGAAHGSTVLEHANTNAAILATTGVIRRMASNGAIARTEFSASTGGWTAGGTFPSVVDEGDAIATNPNRNWTVTLDAAAVGAEYNVGTIQSVEVVARTTADGGRRAATVRITGTAGTVERTGNDFRGDWGLKSTWYTTTVTAGSA